jgi:hypothetical protein
VAVEASALAGAIPPVTKGGRSAHPACGWAPASRLTGGHQAWPAELEMSGMFSVWSSGHRSPML